MKNNRDYTNKTIFVGLDVHKKTYSVAVVCDNVLIKRDTIQAYPEKLLHYLQKYFSGAKINLSYLPDFTLLEVVMIAATFWASTNAVL